MRYCLVGILFALLTVSAIARDLPLHLIQLPPGFKIALYSDEVPNARSMSMSPSGTLFVGSRQAGQVYALRDDDHDGRAEKVYVLASDLNYPNGVAFRNGALYVSEINRILRFDDIEYSLGRPPQPVVISTDFPSDSHHGWKFIRIGPDNKLYVPIGAPCNVCIEYGYGVVTSLDLDGTNHEVYAEGVRNTVGFDWHPDSKELWFTDNGRDMLGDDVPPDELNHAAHKGQHFGFPHCHAGEVVDPEFGLGHSCKEYTSPVQKLGAHVASLGMRFYTGDMFPAQFKKQIFIAEHGSWNRSSKSGYRISLVRLKGNKAIAYEIFAQGWLQGQEAWGRPVDIEHMRDGSLLVSDDKAGAIYRIYYEGSQSAQTIRLPSAVQSTEQPAVPAIQAASVAGQQKAKPSPAKSGNNGHRSNQRTSPTGQDAKLAQPPADIHEKLLQQKQQRSGQGENSKQQLKTVQQGESETPRTDEASPPDELIEKIRQRTEQTNNVPVDPFAPVKKQVVEP